MVIQLLKVFETGFERKSDVKTISSIGILSVPSALFVSKDFIIEFILSVEKDKISVCVLFNAFCLILTILGWYLYWLLLDSTENDVLEGLKPLKRSAGIQNLKYIFSTWK